MFRKSGRTPTFKLFNFLKKYTINVVRMNDIDSHSLDEIIRNASHLNDFKVKANYLGARHIFNLSHSIYLRRRNDKLYAEVVLKEFQPSSFYYVYSICGELQYVEGTWVYHAVNEPTLVVAFKGVTNPLSMIAENGGISLAAILLPACLEDDPERLFPKDWFCFEFKNQGNRVIVHTAFSHDIVVRNRKHDNEQIRFEVLGDAFASGMGMASNQVRYVMATCTPLTDGTLQIIDKDRMAKEVLRLPGSYDIRIEDEFKLADMTKHTKAKRPVSVDLEKVAGRRSFMIERLFHGTNLAQYMHNYPVSKDTSVLQLMRISLQLLRSYHREVDLSGIVHRDIKPRNVMVYRMDKLFPDIHWVDFGLSKPTWVQDPGTTCGTLLYVAPEICDGKNATQAVDVYALGLVIAELWGLRNTDILSDKNANQMHPRSDVERWMYHLFEGGGRLLRKECDQFIGLLFYMCEQNPHWRMSLFGAINELDEMRYNYKLRLRGSDPHFMKARALALEIRPLLYVNKVTQSDFDLEQLCKALGRLFEALHDTPECVLECVETLGTPFFAGCEKVAELQSRLLNLANNFAVMGSALLAACESLRGTMRGSLGLGGLPGYAAYLQYLLKRANRHLSVFPVSLDEAAELSQKFIKNMKLITSETARLQSLPQAPPTLDVVVVPLIGNDLPERLASYFPVLPVEPDSRKISSFRGNKSH